MSRQYFEEQLQEHRRLERYQLQHRGLSFQQVWLPPSTDRKVNMVGKNQHIYRGQIPTFPLDQLPPEVDPESIDRDKLYEELANMTFPEVPPREDYGPTRRIGGEYTRAKRLSFSPVVVRNAQEEHSMYAPILGVNGKVYKGSIRNHLLPRELDPRLSGSKRTQMYHWKTDSTYVSPTVVSLHVDGKCHSEQRTQVPLIQVYMSDLQTMSEAAGSSAREMSFVPRSDQENVGTFQKTRDDEGSTTEEPVISEVEEDVEGGDDGTVIGTEDEDASVTEDESSNANADEQSVGEEPSVGGYSTTENNTDPSVVDIIVGPSNELASEAEEVQNAENSGDLPVTTEAQEEG